jgi:hypothetical protein
MLSFVEKFSLDNQYINVLFVSMIIVPFISGTFSHFINIFKYFVQVLIVSYIEISNCNPDGPETYDWLTYYLSNLMKEKKLYTVTKNIETATSLNKMWYNPNKNSNFPQTRFIPGNSWSIFWDNGVYVMRTEHGDPRSNLWGQTSLLPKKITLYRFFPILNKLFAVNWQEFISRIKKKYEDDVVKYQRVYKNGYQSWEGPMLVNRIGLTDGTFILTEPMKEIVEDIRHFLTDEAKQLYKEKGLHYCKRICVYGSPGTGKSHLATRIAGEFDFPIYYLNCQNVHDTKLEELFDQVQRGIIIIEEIDKCIDELVKFDSDNDDDFIKNVGPSKAKGGYYPRLVAWHKVLDKIIGRQVIVYLTTNNIELLQKLNHGSLIREERIDMLRCFNLIDKNEISKIINSYYKDDIPIPKGFDFDVKTTPSNVINILKDRNTTPDNIYELLNDRMQKGNGFNADNYSVEMVEFLNSIWCCISIF